MDQILSDGKNLQRAGGRCVVAGDKDQEAPQGSVIGPLLFLLFVNDLPSFIDVTTLLFTDDVKMVSPRPQSDLFQAPLCNVWNLSVNWDLPINPTKCNYIAIGRAPPLQLSLATGSPGNSIQVANAVKDPGFLMDKIFSIFCRVRVGAFEESCPFRHES